ncbi:MAG: PDDEXK nuclease domain-containing protein [Blastocatellia bacterium]
MSKLTQNDYAKLLTEIKERIRTAQHAALRAVNKELVALYWDVGRIIVERQKGKTRGKAVVETLSGDLQKEFPGLRGFSVQNLWYMRQFYSTYKDNQKLQPLVGEISWSHNLLIMSRCDDALQREFYIRLTRKYGWSKNALLHHLDKQTYEKTLLSQTNFEQTVAEAARQQAKLAVKDEYTFDFLDLGDQYNERQLEQALLGKVESFLREMGGMFTFIGSQYRLELSGREYFIDLLLFHRLLRALVAIELKNEEFQPEHVGKMQFYLAVLDDQVRLPEENPSIGIILCRTKDRITVEYALRESNKPIGIGTYRIVNRLPAELQGQFPSPEQIVRLLTGIDEENTHD